jgi:hypothetical protein
LRALGGTVKEAMMPDAGINTASMNEGDVATVTVHIFCLLKELAIFIILHNQNRQTKNDTYLTLSICSTGRRSGIGFLLD